MSVQTEAGRDAVSAIRVVWFCLESAGKQVCPTQRTAYLQFLAYGHGALRANDFQPADVATRTALHCVHGRHTSEVYAHTLQQQGAQLLLCQVHLPGVEVLGRQVVIVQHTCQQILVIGVAEGVLHTLQVRLVDVLPGVLELLGTSSAALREACVAYLSLVHQHLTACCPHRLARIGIGLARDAAVALAMVVGTDIEDAVVLAVVPAYDFLVRLGEGEEARTLVLQCLALMYLSQQPAAADDRRRLHELHGAVGIHLAGYYACQVLLHGQYVDGHYLVLVHHQTQRAWEGECLAPFPVKAQPYGDIVQ